MNKIHKKIGKTTAKSLGLKSVVFKDDDVFVTTFKGKNDSIVEVGYNNETKKISRKFVPDEEMTFDGRLNERDITLTSIRRKIENSGSKNEKEKLPLYAEVNNPLYSKENREPGLDYLEIKDKLEKEYFGRTFNDNIHVQIAYNFLDIKKIVGLHVGNAIFAMQNLQRSSKEEKDFLGNLNSMQLELLYKELDSNSKNKFKNFVRNLKPYNMYFDNVFSFLKGNRVDEREQYKIDKNNCNILRIISLLRQGTLHTRDSMNYFFNLDNKCNEEILNYAESFFDCGIRNFKEAFIKNSNINIGILTKVFGKWTTKQVVKRYYDLCLNKDSKNLGISLQKIKEKIILNYFAGKYDDDKELIQKRPKINCCLEFLLSNYFSDSRIIALYIERLRSAKNDEEKEKIYDEISNETIDSNSSILNKIVDVVDFAFDEFDKKSTKEALKEITSEEIREILEDDNEDNSINICTFAQFVYILCKFIDGKEVNELVTSIINKLENIDSLIEVAKKINVWTGFSAKYNNLNLENEIYYMAADFRIVKNLTSTKTKLKKANNKDKYYGKSIFIDAINSLKEKDFIDYENDRDGEIEFAKYGDKLLSKGKTNTLEKDEKKVKNILINSVINNRRFLYLIKYYDPRKCNAIIKNKELMNFVFYKKTNPKSEEYDISDSQIISYYSKVTGKALKECEGLKRTQMVETLINKLQNVSIDAIMGSGSMLLEDVQYAETQKQVLSLYFTVAYLIVKGIVHTNSVYYLGWSAFERDMNLVLNKNTNIASSFDYLDLVEFYKDKKFNKKKKFRIKKLIELNESEVQSFNGEFKNAYIVYRNKVSHLNICFEFINYIDGIKEPKSYYDIYNYCLEKMMLDKNVLNLKGESKIMIKLKEDLDTHGAYQRDFLKLINLPFAYSMARYKNLTIGDLFNDNYPLPKETNESWLRKDSNN